MTIEPKMRELCFVHRVLVALLALAMAACVPAPAPSRAPSPTPRQLPTALPTARRTASPTRSPTTSTTQLPATPTPAPEVEWSIRYIQMMDRTTGWAVAQFQPEAAKHVLRTTDGGATWRDVSPAPVKGTGDDIPAYFLDSDSAWVWHWSQVGLLRTTDGGQNWESVGDIGRTPAVNAVSIGFADRQHGWKLLGSIYGLSYVNFDVISFATTQDGGETWQETNPLPGYSEYTLAAFPSGSMAWAIRAHIENSDYGVRNLDLPMYVHSTSDGGGSWVSYALPLPAGTTSLQDYYGTSYLAGVGRCEFILPAHSSTSVWKFALSCEEKGWKYDLSPDHEYHGWLYTTATQGKTWIISALPPGGEPMDVQFLDPKVGWLFLRDPLDDSQGRLFQTTNGGESWSQVKSTGWTDVQLDFLDPETGWAVATSCAHANCGRDEQVRALVKTVDGGRTWQLVQPALAP